MAAKMPPRPAVAQLQPLTEGELAVQKNQGAAIQEDVKALIALDIQKPFHNLQDAIQRLIPFHVSMLLRLGAVSGALCANSAEAAAACPSSQSYYHRSERLQVSDQPSCTLL
jgi:hypothetical protein